MYLLPKLKTKPQLLQNTHLLMNVRYCFRLDCFNIFIQHGLLAPCNHVYQISKLFAFAYQVTLKALSRTLTTSIPQNTSLEIQKSVKPRSSYDRPSGMSDTNLDFFQGINLSSDTVTAGVRVLTSCHGHRSVYFPIRSLRPVGSGLHNLSSLHIHKFKT